MTISVTAASGKLGSEIIRKLARVKGAEPVIALARTPDHVEDLGIEVRPGDYDVPEQLRESLAGVDTLLLVSGMATPDERIQQHRNVIDAAKSAGVQKIVYTSIQGPEEGTDFSPIVQSNRQTEADIRSSGLAWAIGRNGIYIEPDVEYIETYRAEGEIANRAGGGKCGYTTYPELGEAYARLLTSSAHDMLTLDLNGSPITQVQLAEYLNGAFGTALTYRALTSEPYRKERTEALGSFIGPIIAGIYDGIRLGAYDRAGDFEVVLGRAHISWADYFGKLKSGADIPSEGR